MRFFYQVKQLTALAASVEPVGFELEIYGPDLRQEGKGYAASVGLQAFSGDKPEPLDPDVWVAQAPKIDDSTTSAQWQTNAAEFISALVTHQVLQYNRNAVANARAQVIDDFESGAALLPFLWEQDQGHDQNHDQAQAKAQPTKHQAGVVSYQDQVAQGKVAGKRAVKRVDNLNAAVQNALYGLHDGLYRIVLERQGTPPQVISDLDTDLCLQEGDVFTFIRLTLIASY